MNTKPDATAQKKKTRNDMSITVEQFFEKRGHANHDCSSPGRGWAIASGETDMAALWLRSDMPPFVRMYIASRKGVFSQQEQIRLACWCVRQIWHLLQYQDSKAAVETAERWVEGQATDEELRVASEAAGNVQFFVESHFHYDREVDYGPDAARAAQDAAIAAIWGFAHYVYSSYRSATEATRKARAGEAACRKNFGNPYSTRSAADAVYAAVTDVDHAAAQAAQAAAKHAYPWGPRNYLSTDDEYMAAYEAAQAAEDASKAKAEAAFAVWMAIPETARGPTYEACKAAYEAALGTVYEASDAYPVVHIKHLEGEYRADGTIPIGSDDDYSYRQAYRQAYLAFLQHAATRASPTAAAVYRAAAAANSHAAKTAYIAREAKAKYNAIVAVGENMLAKAEAAACDAYAAADATACAGWFCGKTPNFEASCKT
jgi:hypothetical protein